MQPSPYLAELLAGLFFLIVGIRLLRLSYRTGESPEWQLGAYFALAGMSYLAVGLPKMVGITSLSFPSDFASRAFYSIGMVPFVQFTRDVYRQQSSWAPWLYRFILSSLLIGIIGAVATGEWEGIYSPWFWFYCLGYSTAIVWMTIEAILAHSAARKRSRIGLCEPRIVNRYLLWAWFGVFQTLACAVVIAWESEYASAEAVSSVMEMLLSITEIVSVGAVWLAFFSPSIYRRWIARSAADAAEAGRG